MRKKLLIDGKEYEVCSSAFSMFIYKKEFKTGIMADIGRLQEFVTKQDAVTKEMQGKTKDEIDGAVGLALMPEMDTYIEIALRLAYVFIRCANPNFMSFEEWLMTVENFSFEAPWVSEVTELAVNSFCGYGTVGEAKTSQVAKREEQ